MTAYLAHVRKFLVGLALIALPIAAQTGRGTVTGTIMDPSGGKVPKAAVTLTSDNTGAVLTTHLMRVQTGSTAPR